MAYEKEIITVSPVRICPCFNSTVPIYTGSTCSCPLQVHLHSPAGPGSGPSPQHAYLSSGCLDQVPLLMAPVLHGKCSVRDDNGETGQPLGQAYPSASEENRIQQPSPLLLADGSALAESPESLQLA